MSAPTPSSANNIQILATKNKLLQQIDTTVKNLVTTLEKKSDYKGFTKDELKEVFEKVKALKKAGTASGVVPTEVTEESVIKDIQKGKVSAEKLQQLQAVKGKIATQQAQVNTLEAELQTLKQAEQALVKEKAQEEATHTKNKETVTKLQGDIAKAKEEWKRKLAEAERQLKIVKEQSKDAPDHASRLAAAEKKLQEENDLKIKYDSDSTQNLENVKKKYPYAQEFKFSKETALTQKKTEVKAKEDKLQSAKEEVETLQQQLKKLQADIVTEKERNSPSFGTKVKEEVTGAVKKLVEKATQKATVVKAPSAEGEGGEPQTDGANPTLAELLQTYQTKVYIDTDDIQKLTTAFTKFKTEFDTSYDAIKDTTLKNQTDKQKAFDFVWKLQGWNRAFPNQNTYIQDLFKAYEKALNDESAAVSKANPAFTKDQIKEELEKRIRGVLPAKDLQAIRGAPGAVGSASGKGEAGAGERSGEGEEGAFGMGMGSTGEGSSSPLGSAVGKGLMDGFNILYTIFGALGAALVLGTFFLSSIDILKFSVLEVWQYIMLFINPNMFNKETLDFSTLLYAKNSEKDEPYTIFLQQQFISFMFRLVTYFINAVVLQIGIFMILKVLKSLGKVEFDEGLDFGPAKKAIGVMVITIASAFIQNTYYNTSFLNSVQPGMIASTSNIKDMANVMYNNISNHNEFLTSVVNENLSKCIEIINAQGDRYGTISSMIFTLSLYNFFKINIPSESPEFNIIRDVFTIKEKRVRSINPTDYMYFQQNVFIPNLYAMVEPYISGSTNVLNTPAKRDTVRKEVGARIMSLNRLLMGLFLVPTRRSSFRNYIYFGWILALAFVVGIYSIYRAEIDLIYANFVKPFLASLNEFFWIIVMPWDIRSSKDEQTTATKKE